MTVAEVLRQVLAGIEEEGLERGSCASFRSIDLGYIGSTAARLSGSGVSVGLQGKGTALIHRSDLPPLANLELFSIAPRVTELYRGLGRNAARYAKGARRSRSCSRNRASRSARATTPRRAARRDRATVLEGSDPVEVEASMADLTYPCRGPTGGGRPHGERRTRGRDHARRWSPGATGGEDVARRVRKRSLLQADFAEERRAGNPQLARGLRRGAELPSTSFLGRRGSACQLLRRCCALGPLLRAVELDSLMKGERPLDERVARRAGPPGSRLNEVARGWFARRRRRPLSAARPDCVAFTAAELLLLKVEEVPRHELREDDFARCRGSSRLA